MNSSLHVVMCMSSSLSAVAFREELAKQQAAARYRKLHLEGKTDEAQADLARLALIRKQREEAAKRREEEAKGIQQILYEY